MARDAGRTMRGRALHAGARRDVLVARRDGARKVVDLWAERTAALGARPEIAYVLVFENRGAEVGATIPHPHGQIYAYDFVPPNRWPAARAQSAGAACVRRAGRPACRDRPGLARLGARASIYPYALVLVPDTHVPDLPSLDPGGRDEARTRCSSTCSSGSTGSATPRLPYMLWFHQRPFDGGDWPQAALHVEIVVAVARARGAALTSPRASSAAVCT